MRGESSQNLYCRGHFPLLPFKKKSPQKNLTMSPELNPAVAGAQFPIGPTAYRNLETRPIYAGTHACTHTKLQLIFSEVLHLTADCYSVYLQRCVHGNGWLLELSWRCVSPSGRTGHCQFSWSDNVWRHQWDCVHTQSHQCWKRFVLTLMTVMMVTMVISCSLSHEAP